MDHLTERAITLLRREGRLSYTEIARRLGASRMNVASRLGPLFESEALRVIAAVHPRLLGLDTLAHLTVRTSGPSGRTAEHIGELSSPVFLSETTGPFQLIVELHTATLTDLYAEVQRIRALPDVIEVDVQLYEQLVSSFFLGQEPAQGTAPSVDRMDLAIIEQLQLDGRLGYSELGRRVGLSTSAARDRVNRLLDSGVMQIGVTHGRAAADRKLVFGLGIAVSGAPDSAIALLIEEPGLELLARAVGRFALVATVTFNSLDEFTGLLERVRALPAVQHLDQWLHTKIHVEQYHRGTHQLATVKKT